MNNITATIEYGVSDYRLAEESFSATSIHDLIDKINTKTMEWGRVLEEADARDGDLRQFTPQYANGYVGLSGCTAEFGDDMFSGTITDLRVNGKELDYHSVGYRLVRDGASLS